MKTILAPIDFSGASEAVVQEAATLARAMSGRVVVLAVLQPMMATSEYIPMIENMAEITAAGEKATAIKLAEVERKLTDAGVPAETVQFTGAPVTHIVEQAAQRSADYVVMGSHGHSAMYDLLVGSTTHGVLMRVKCPVVIVPPHDAKPPRPRK